VVTSYHALKGTTGAPVTERYYALDALWRVSDNVVRHLDWFSELLPELRINKEHMRKQAWVHWATATDLASALVRKKDLPWRSAHQIVGILVRLCEQRGLGPADVTPALLDEAAIAYDEHPVKLTQADIDQALDAGNFIASRTLQGGPAPRESLRQAELFKHLLIKDEKAVADVEQRLAASRGKLREAVDVLIQT
jgi:argininosuccinate lyase